MVRSSFLSPGDGRTQLSKFEYELTRYFRPLQRGSSIPTRIAPGDMQVLHLNMELLTAWHPNARPLQLEGQVVFKGRISTLSEEHDPMIVAVDARGNLTASGVLETTSDPVQVASELQLDLHLGLHSIGHHYVGDIHLAPGIKNDLAGHSFCGVTALFLAIASPVFCCITSTLWNNFDVQPLVPRDAFGDYIQLQIDHSLHALFSCLGSQTSMWGVIEHDIYYY